jgi:hypothetical protein
MLGFRVWSLHLRAPQAMALVTIRVWVFWVGVRVRARVYVVGVFCLLGFRVWSLHLRAPQAMALVTIRVWVFWVGVRVSARVYVVVAFCWHLLGF